MKLDHFFKLFKYLYDGLFRFYSNILTSKTGLIFLIFKGTVEAALGQTISDNINRIITLSKETFCLTDSKKKMDFGILRKIHHFNQIIA